MECNNQLAFIPSQTQRNLTLNQSGNYAVEIKKNTCTIISDCYQLIVVATKDQIVYDDITIWPNPNSGTFEIHSGNSLDKSILKIHTMEGKELFMTQLHAHTNNLQVNLKSGIYFLTINTNGYQYRTKLMIHQ